MTAERDNGFTLIETLVAMAVLAVAATGLIRITGAHVEFIQQLETRSIALWVAENRLAELELPRSAPLSGTVRILDRDWRVSTRVTPASDPDLVAIEVGVSGSGGGRPLVTLRSFKPNTAAR